MSDGSTTRRATAPSTSSSRATGGTAKRESPAGSFAWRLSASSCSALVLSTSRRAKLRGDVVRVYVHLHRPERIRCQRLAKTTWQRADFDPGGVHEQEGVALL